MTTLEQLLDNFRNVSVKHYFRDATEEELKAAQDAIVAHVEGAMGDARRFGFAWQTPIEEDWEELVGMWTE